MIKKTPIHHIIIFSSLLLFLGLGGQGCHRFISEKQELTRKDRQICLGRTSDQSVSPDGARRNLAECLKDVKSGKLRIEQNDIVPAVPAKESTLTGNEQYKYCVLHRDQIKSYYDVYNGNSARLAVLERNLGPSDEQTIRARERLADAQKELQQLLPPKVIGDMPLVPDAAIRFSSCDRSTFIP